MVSTLIAVEQNTMEEDKIKLRKVTTKDLFTVVRVVVPRLDMVRIRKIFNDIPQDNDARDNYFKTAGMELLLMVLEVATDEEIQKWLSDMAGLTYEQFLDSDVDTSFKIVQAMWDDKDINKLFRTLLQ